MTCAADGRGPTLMRLSVLLGLLFVGCCANNNLDDSSSSTSAAGRELLAEKATTGQVDEVVATLGEADEVQHTGLPDKFVRVQNGKFTIGGDPFIFAGWNIWEILEAASYAPAPFRYLNRDGREMITKMMNQAVDRGLTVMRMWGHTITEGHAFQTAPGEYNEEIFKAFDFILDEARKRGIKIIIVFADNWYPVNGVQNYVKWAKGDNADKTSFFTDGAVESLYKRNINNILQRRNSINGRQYKNDNTIMAWNLANEVRCTGCPTWKIQNWIDRIAKYVKSIDSNHLIGVGHEGFFGPDSPMVKYNPNGDSSDWASKEGQDFLENHRSPDVDYVGIHVWPDNWDIKTTEFLKTFIKVHIDAARELGKPFVLEEFGKIVNDKDPKWLRDKYFQAAYEVAEENAKLTDGIVQGTMFWHWYDIGVGPGRYGIYVTDNAFEIVKKHAQVMNNMSPAKKK